ncbi:MAG TPA: 50S ribosomal protein L20 [Pseudothermotoga sp.]|uniref:50S ribosomal protein L20 n=1 Tax=Thermotoga profunda TaxID=1508420 RepID=UPI0005977720|nr:50S ribosomal protein L20 [Thermotoga profunda]
MRIKRSLHAKKKRRERFLKAAKGYRGAISRRYKLAKQHYYRAKWYAYVGRKIKKRDYRSLWITRINIAARQNGLKYSQLMHGLKLANVAINRKMLAELAVNDPSSFSEYVKIAKEHLEKHATV